MPSDLVVALAGGAVGSTVTLAARLSAVPRDVDRHDRRARALDEDLAYWVADDHRRLRQELEKVANELNERNLFYSSIHGVARAEAKTSALHRYRDHLAEAERKLADALAAEGWAHDLWRKLRRRPSPSLATPGHVERVIDEWRADVTSHGDRAPVHDPTRWTTDDVVRDVEERPLEPS